MRHPQLSVQTPGTLPRGAETTPPVTPTKSDEKDTRDILRYTDDAQIHHDSHDQAVEFGRGAWSTVYKASSVPKPTTEVLTPPSSPATSSGRIVAVKVPTRRDAYPVLETEARILTRLVRAAGAEHHIVSFWGIVPRSHALVMDAVPATLSGYIEEQAERVKGQRDTKTLFEPVLGLQGWLGLCRALVRGLNWLHGNSIVHGDVKPHNILLRRACDTTDSNNDFPYTPLFADFSSAHELSPSPTAVATNTNTMTALTPPFTAPELLVLSSLKSPDIAPTPASDNFSLAVTLLAAATGDLLLYPGTNHMQRLAMAREGHRVVEFARSGMAGCRVRKDGVVERIVAPAVVKVPEERISTVEWVSMVDGICEKLEVENRG